MLTSSQWSKAESKGWTGGVQEFEVGGRKYQWKRTHSHEFGLTRWSSKSFKLVDLEADGRVLALFRHTQTLFGDKRKQLGRFEVFDELSRELELSGLVVALGIQEKIRQSEQAAAASGGGGGGGGC